MTTASTPRLPLWELDVDCHGPLVGCGWSAAELRRITDTLFAGQSSLDDFALQVAVVGQCSTRNKLSLMLQRRLDQQASAMLRRVAAAGSVQDLAALWQGALRNGAVGVGLWALWTDPRCDDALRTRMHQDLYLLQHARVASLPIDAAERAAGLARQQAQQADALRAEQRHARWRSEALAERDALQAQLALLRRRVLAQEAEIARLQQIAASGVQPPAPREQLVQRVFELSRQLAEARQSVKYPRAAPAAAVADPPQSAAAVIAPMDDPALAAPPVLPELHAASVLCVGGRSGHVPLYRELVERRGGCFIHHDGGIEHNPRRLDAQLAAADLVLCQAGCLNHNAYARVKAHIKRSGKPCVYLDKPGAGSFVRALAESAAALPT